MQNTDNRTASTVSALLAASSIDPQKRVSDLAEALAEEMHKIHGGRLSININHETQFVLIAQNDFGVRNISKPKRGRIV